MTRDWAIGCLFILIVVVIWNAVLRDVIWNAICEEAGLKFISSM